MCVIVNQFRFDFDEREFKNERLFRVNRAFCRDLFKLGLRYAVRSVNT